MRDCWTVGHPRYVGVPRHSADYKLVYTTVRGVTSILYSCSENPGHLATAVQLSTWVSAEYTVQVKKEEL